MAKVDAIRERQEMSKRAVASPARIDVANEKRERVAWEERIGHWGLLVMDFTEKARQYGVMQERVQNQLNQLNDESKSLREAIQAAEKKLEQLEAAK
jgi:hypothetical protein